MIEAEALVVTGPDTVELGKVRLPRPGKGQLLIESEFSCISPGTELRTMACLGPDAEYPPYVPGYSVVGRVVAAGEGAEMEVGTRVFSAGAVGGVPQARWGAHSSVCLVNEESALAVGDELPAEEACLLKLAAIAYRGCRLANPSIGERVVVLGLGPIGQLSARCFSACGASVVGIDLDQARVDLLRSAGIEAMRGGLDAPERLKRLWGCGADIVVDSTGVASVVSQALEYAREKPWDNSEVPGIRLVLQGSLRGDFSLDYDTAFCRETTVLVPRDNQRRDLEGVFTLMKEGAVSFTGIVSEVRRPIDAPAAYADLRARKGGLVTIAFDWR